MDHDYEVKPYVPLKEQAFADSNLPPEAFDDFSDGFDDGVAEEQPFEPPTTESGDIAIVTNLDGIIDFTKMEGVPEQYGDSMDVMDYLEMYFNEKDADLLPIQVGSEVMIAQAALDAVEDGEVIDHPDDLVVVTAAPEGGESEFDPTGTGEWYVFLRKDNLNLFQFEDSSLEGEVIITNFEGNYSRPLPLEDGGDTRSVQTYVTDHLKHGFVPYSFAIGYKGYVRPSASTPGSIEFYNTNTQSLKGRTDWYINLLPSNVTGVSADTTDDESEGKKVREKKQRTRDTTIIRGRNIKDSTTRVSYWVNPKNGKVKESQEAPGRIWLQVPVVTTPSGNSLQGSLAGIVKLCDQLGTKYTQVNSKSGNPIEVRITSDNMRWKDNLKSLGGNRPITAEEIQGELILKYR